MLLRILRSAAFILVGILVIIAWDGDFLLDWEHGGIFDWRKEQRIYRVPLDSAHRYAASPVSFFSIPPQTGDYPSL